MNTFSTTLSCKLKSFVIVTLVDIFMNDFIHIIGRLYDFDSLIEVDLFFNRSVDALLSKFLLGNGYLRFDRFKYLVLALWHLKYLFLINLFKGLSSLEFLILL